jgi:hypothetical protein
LWGAVSEDRYLEWDVRADHRFYKSDEERLRAILDRDARIDERNIEVSRANDLKAFITINQLVNVSLSEWIGRTDWQATHGYGESLKTALLAEVQTIIEDRSRKQRDIEQKAKLENLKVSETTLQLPHKLGGIQGYLS